MTEEERYKKILRRINRLILFFVLTVVLFAGFLFQRWNNSLKPQVFLGCGTENTVPDIIIEHGPKRATLDIGNFNNGRKLFRSHCAACHQFQKKLTGPALNGIIERVPAPADQYLLKYIKNSEKLRKEGDEYAMKIFIENDKALMMPFEYLTDQEIKDIITYITGTSSDVVVTSAQNQNK